VIQQAVEKGPSQGVALIPPISRGQASRALHLDLFDRHRETAVFQQDAGADTPRVACGEEISFEFRGSAFASQTTLTDPVL
jgi:hypothetical protein